MLLTITTTHQPATDLGYLLHKNPARLQTLEVAAGQAHIFYPEASAERCTVALLLDIDPVALVRNHRGPAGEGFALEQYVNDRPYVASSFLSVALAKAFNTAMNGTCKDRPELPDTLLPLEATVAVVPAATAEQLQRLFAPLGYEVETEAHPLDPTVPAWGNSRYFTLRLRHPARRLRELLSHLYVLIPVLDNDKHYWVNASEAEKLLHRGADWLPQHPDREFITRRYLRNLAQYVNPTLERLLDADETPADDEPEAALATVEVSAEAAAPAEKQNLHDLRLDRVAEEIRRLGAKRVLDLGCGEGKLARRLLKMPHVEHILAIDVSYRELQRAHERLHVAEMPPRQRERLTLAQGSLLYHDPRLAGYDAAAVVEVIEHLDENRLAAFEQVVFARARPGAVLVTTPNADYNQRYETLSAGEFRHADHRFEWTRAQFAEWAAGVAARHGYVVHVLPLGPEAAEVGAPSQLAVFEQA
ncbi:3' terminal RNA ribose 2'-O-methyltransferase Hen1 [Hymenobacter busanensis]|uniref:Small RNA 2'-O-methyltransferase n=1 Tax=Hymenobacter busanensis TaxID=2607656 RepID=A0A7L4ZSC6_9BACT|nr:3' terminal RNA ribose 2'-O-methyltransferase Hen1 [Hymenobacter busanensis]KAA9327449.1 3' terminal RNA ribose 2'-O-methyltransferase Hen1 [Hymenobacter busanensis]QHJ06214.1 3' terminal RNA ribose 2'-O-methyltransferase Hen1 [Hymenobacter busanensis]